MTDTNQPSLFPGQCRSFSPSIPKPYALRRQIAVRFATVLQRPPSLSDFWLTISAPTSLFHVSVESKGLSVPVSSLDATLTEDFISVDSKRDSGEWTVGIGQRRNQRKPLPNSSFSTTATQFESHHADAAD
jgi:hypothetical protein